MPQQTQTARNNGKKSPFTTITGVVHHPPGVAAATEHPPAGMRFVRPYYHTYRMNIKGNMEQMSLIALLCFYFHRRDKAYYVCMFFLKISSSFSLFALGISIIQTAAINGGKIVVNGKKATSDRIMKPGDVVQHCLHIHEPPITAELPQILSSTEQLIVVNKPAGMPVRIRSFFPVTDLHEN